MQKSGWGLRGWQPVDPYSFFFEPLFPTVKSVCQNKITSDGLVVSQCADVSLIPLDFTWSPFSPMFWFLPSVA